LIFWYFSPSFALCNHMERCRGLIWYEVINYNNCANTAFCQIWKIREPKFYGNKICPQDERDIAVLAVINLSKQQSKRVMYFDCCSVGLCTYPCPCLNVDFSRS
jgi:hypothetical protein